METETERLTLFQPLQPHHSDELDISFGLVSDLVLRRAYMDGICTIRSLSETLKLSPLIVDQVFHKLRDQRLLDVKGSVGDDYEFGLTTSGHRLALGRMKITHYAGPAPVSLRNYSNAVRAQRANVEVSRAVLKRCLSDLVLSDEIVDKLGPAVMSQKSIFLYGGTGNGKTSIAERLHRVYDDRVLIPYAVDVDGQIIVIYDPVVHRKVDAEQKSVDPRWVLCERPLLMVGGEMNVSMLELRLDEVSRSYAAPVQMKANNGILVIDDFGRQTMSPRKLLNRWIIPLDRRVDYLTLQYGMKFDVPFEMMVVFATNLNPSHLADDAFLRRLHNKIYIGPADETLFDQILYRNVERLGIHIDEDTSPFLRQLIQDAGCPELRACLPGDILDVATWIANYEGRSGSVAKDDLRRAVDVYFTRALPETNEGPFGLSEE